jgi:fimbrial chaperone protein
MKRISLAAAAVATAITAFAPAAHSGSLQVAPVTIEVVAPTVATVVQLRNDGATAVTAQLRVFRWSQVDGVERLEPATDVVVSPPVAQLPSRSEYTVRLIRSGHARPAGEESFRLIVDELPAPGSARSGSVAIVVRHSLPVFFRPPQLAAAELTWELEQSGGRRVLKVHNAGQRRVRLAALSLRDGAGMTSSLGNGLAGYVLANSTMRFPLPASSRSLGKGPLRVTAQGDLGPIDASVTPPNP